MNYSHEVFKFKFVMAQRQFYLEAIESLDEGLIERSHSVSVVSEDAEIHDDGHENALNFDHRFPMRQVPLIGPSARIVHIRHAPNREFRALFVTSLYSPNLIIGNVCSIFRAAHDMSGFRQLALRNRPEEHHGQLEDFMTRVELYPLFQRTIQRFANLTRPEPRISQRFFLLVSLAGSLVVPQEAREVETDAGKRRGLAGILPYTEPRIDRIGPLNIINPQVGYLGKTDFTIQNGLSKRVFGECEFKCRINLRTHWKNGPRILGQSFLDLAGSGHSECCLLLADAGFVLLWRLFVKMENGIPIYECFEFPGHGQWRRIIGFDQEAVNAREELCEIAALFGWVANVPVRHVEPPVAVTIPSSYASFSKTISRDDENENSLNQDERSSVYSGSIAADLSDRQCWQECGLLKPNGEVLRISCLNFDALRPEEAARIELEYVKHEMEDMDDEEFDSHSWLDKC